jgi:hypothetical protein
MWIENLAGTVWDLCTVVCSILMVVRLVLGLLDWWKSPGTNTRIVITIEDSGESVKWDVTYGGQSLKKDYHIQLMDGNVKVMRGKRAQPPPSFVVTPPTTNISSVTGKPQRSRYQTVK